MFGTLSHTSTRWQSFGDYVRGCIDRVMRDLEQIDGACDVDVIVQQWIGDALSDGLLACEMDHRIDRMLLKDSIDRLHGIGVRSIDRLIA